jgi:hypothetical protein
MICPVCGEPFDHRASSHQGPECDRCSEEKMSDTISRWAAVAALEAYLTPYRGTIDTGSIHRNGVIGDVIAAIRALPAAPAPQPWTEEELAKAIRPELDDLATDVTEDFFMTVAESIARVALSRPLAKVDVEDVRLVAEYRMPGTDAVFDIDDVTAAAYRILAAIWEGKP